MHNSLDNKNPDRKDACKSLEILIDYLDRRVPPAPRKFASIGTQSYDNRNINIITTKNETKKPEDAAKQDYSQVFKSICSILETLHQKCQQ